MKDKYQPHRLA